MCQYSMSTYCKWLCHCNIELKVSATCWKTARHYDPLTEQEKKLRFCLPLVLCFIGRVLQAKGDHPSPTMLSNLYCDVRELVCPLRRVRTEPYVSARWINAGDQLALPCSVRLKGFGDAPFTMLKSYSWIRR
jgi:hypothetical protein